MTLMAVAGIKGMLYNYLIIKFFFAELEGVPAVYPMLPRTRQPRANSRGAMMRNGAAPIVLTAMEFMQRLAALVPRPRLHLMHFHGVLAPNAKLRAQVMPTPAPQTTAGEGDCLHAHSKPVRLTWARLLKRVLDRDVEQRSCGNTLVLIQKGGLKFLSPTVRRMTIKSCMLLQFLN
jgi:hypothetical protein